ncbi:MAG: uracil-DNA glycosylase [Rhodothermales bacterium]
MPNTGRPIIPNPVLADAFAFISERLFNEPSPPGLFNPYITEDPRYDRDHAAALRRANLARYFAAYPKPPRVLLQAEAPGPWGCRFSGIPLVSEAQLIAPNFPLDGHPTSLADPPHHEYSARIYWRTLQPYFPQFFTWNTVPYHPFKTDQPMSIRTPKTSEVKAYGELAQGLVERLQPERVIAIGRKAEYILNSLGIDCIYVRHPSQGGAKLFAEGVQAVMAAL